MKIQLAIESEQIVVPSSARLAPSASLMSAALVGLLGSALVGCGDDQAEVPDDDAGQASPWDAGNNDDETEEDDASREQDGDNADGGAQADAATGPEVLSEVEGNLSYASLRGDCDTRGGYMQVHASCSGSNDCAGFSYGDWDPGVLTEHTCAAANGCAGASCIVLPKDSGKTPEEILFAEELPAGGPQPCWFCHAESEHQPDGSYTKDMTKFKVWISEGSTRNAQNWLDLSPEAQEAIVAFGKVGVIGVPGQEVALRSMKGYHQIYARAEIQRVVAHLRKMVPVIAVFKTPK